MLDSRDSTTWATPAAFFDIGIFSIGLTFMPRLAWTMIRPFTLPTEMKGMFYHAQILLVEIFVPTGPKPQSSPSLLSK
jgi:hypothetical protein